MIGEAALLKNGFIAKIGSGVQISGGIIQIHPNNVINLGTE